MYCMSLYLKFFAQFQCNDTALQITTNFSDDIYFLHAFYLKFTINASVVYIPVESTTFSMSSCPSCAVIITVNIFNNGISVCLLCPDFDPS